ncbi:MAG: thioredoxin family protein [Odoribacter sp.]|nr:thioredoxin family protein [Odoribacter sp.]
MRKIIILLAALFAGIAVHAQGIDFQTKSYAEVLEMAKKQQKLVFIDVYTSWCGPCKHMAKEIFTQQKAGDFYNAHFLNLKLDAEKDEDGKTVAAKFGVNAYPTMLFVDGNGELIYRLLGGKSIDDFVAEGQKALDAYAAKPLLEKNEKLYQEGKRDKEFLMEYFMLKDKAGLDCSDILVDYFAQVKDKELLNTLNVACIAKVSVYKPDLAKRWVKAVCQGVKTEKDKKLLNSAKKSVCIYLGACLKEAAKSDDEKMIEEVLGLKSRLFEKAGITESITMASLGGGNIYIFSNLLRLDYYNNKNKKELFVPLFEKYVLEVITDAEKRGEERNKVEEEMNKKMEEARKTGNKNDYQAIKKMKGMMSVFSGMDDYYISSQLLNYLEVYADYYTGVKDRAFEDKIVSWYQALHRVNPSVKSAVYVADKLLEMNRKQEAIDELELALSKGQNAMGVEPADREACQNKLEELRK